MFELNHGGTARSWAAVRALLGGYLAVHFAGLIPWAGETFVTMGTPATSPLYPLVPSLLWIAPTEGMATAMAAIGTLLALVLALGIRDRPVAAGLLWLLASFFAANPLILNPGLPHVGWMLLATALVPAAPSLRAALAGTSRSWHLPPAVFAAGWTVMVLGYGYSGWTKLGAPSWEDGTALWHVLHNPLPRPTALRAWLLDHPGLLAVLTWSMLGLELAAPILALSRLTRPLLWTALLALHVGALLTLDFADLTWGLLVLQAWTFDPDWPRREGCRMGRPPIRRGHSSLSASRQASMSTAEPASP